jgi:hypothetical protein
VFIRGTHMTTIELTDLQRQALQAKQGQPVDVVDPATQQRYVLLALEQYERVRPLLEQGELCELQEPAAAIPPGILRSQQAFWHDLPELLKQKSRQRRYAAYHGDQRIGFGRTQTELYQECFRRGLAREAFYVGLLEERDVPPWASTQLERSLYEFSDVGPPGAVLPPS